MMRVSDMSPCTDCMLMINYAHSIEERKIVNRLIPVTGSLSLGFALRQDSHLPLMQHRYIE
jgi:hypothetical protein